MSRPSIVPIALTLDDRTGYTLWAPPWEEDGEEWQAVLGSTTGDDDSDALAVVHLFPSPAALATAVGCARTDSVSPNPATSWRRTYGRMPPCW